MMKVIIKDKDMKIECDNGKLLRTPTEFYISDENKKYWEMKLNFNGIREYNIIEIERPKPKVKIEKKIPLNYIPTRPSVEKMRSEIENGK